MRLLSCQTNFQFTRYARSATVVSLVLIALSVTSLVTGNLSFGIDFTGGVVVDARYPQAVKLDAVRSAIEKGGYQHASVTHFGSAQAVSIRLPPQPKQDKTKLGDQMLKTLAAGPEGASIQRVQVVGPQVGQNLLSKGGLAFLYTVIAILIYVIFRFHWKLALGAVAALIHDIVITLGVFSVTSMEFNLTVLAAILAVLGYSLNDTIVVFDRVRENFRRMRKATPVEVINTSINQTLARTIVTAGTTLLTLFALFFLGGQIIHGFAAALLVGVGIGTYSSIFVASVLALWLKLTSYDLFPPKEEDAERDARPTE
ncbi:protein translocase subunit SecF [Salinisphaera orenii]|uniref:protein translocase subunit SecF n=1 Tax=Salinisphaera orenii TaxID=856731 RepID=UPI000DBE0B8A